MQIFVFKTNITTQSRLKHISPLFKNHPVVREWSVDMEDRDHVLRIVTFKPLNEDEIIYLVNICGYSCEPLTD